MTICANKQTVPVNIYMWPGVLGRSATRGESVQWVREDLPYYCVWGSGSPAGAMSELGAGGRVSVQSQGEG